MYEKWRLKMFLCASTVIRELFVYFQIEGNRVPRGGHLILVRVPMLRPMKDRQNSPKQCVPSFCENNIFSAFSETQAVLSPQLGYWAGTSTRVPEVRVG